MEKLSDIKLFLKNRGEEEALFIINKMLMTLPYGSVVAGGNNPHAANGEWSDIYLILKIKKLISDTIVYRYRVAKIHRANMYHVNYTLGKEYKYYDQAANAAINCNVNF